jgi:hypothetical protein
MLVVDEEEGSENIEMGVSIRNEVMTEVVWFLDRLLL